MGYLPLQGHGVSTRSPGRPWEAHFQPLNMSWPTRSWMSGCLNPWACSPETHTNTHTVTTVYVPQRSEKAVKQRKEESTKSLHAWTHKVSVHLLHPVSHVGHHVVEHAERVPHHVLHDRKRKRIVKRPEELDGWARTPHCHSVLSAHKQLHPVYKHTCMEYSVLNVSCMCAIWDTVTRTFTFYHLTICDLLTKLETKSSMQINTVFMSLFRVDPV